MPKMPVKIEKNGRQRWRGNVQVKGVRRFKLFNTRRQALAWESETRAAMKAAMTPTGYLTIREWLNRYLEFCELEFQPRTFRQKRVAIKRYLQEAGVRPQKPVESVSKPGVMVYLTAQRKARGGSAANYDRKNLSAAWSWGEDNLAGWPQVPNPFKAIKKFKVEGSPRYVPPEADFWRVYDAADRQEQVMLLTLLHTAGRKSEVLRLQWHDIDWPTNQIRLSTRKRAGGIEYDLIPMTGELRAALRGWWEDRPIKDTPYLFVALAECNASSRYYGKPFTSLAKWMPRLCKAAQVKPFGFHAIRHLTASILYNRGVDKAIIQAILRHKRASTTDIYLRSLGLEIDGVGEALKRPGKVVELKGRIENE